MEDAIGHRLSQLASQCTDILELFAIRDKIVGPPVPRPRIHPPLSTSDDAAISALIAVAMVVTAHAPRNVNIK